MRSKSADKPSWGLRLAAFGGLAFMHIPVWIIVLYAFSADGGSYDFPPQGYTLDWFSVAFSREDMWEALWLSIRVAAIATVGAMVFGTLAAAGMAKGRFVGKEAITLLMVLPIALPGVVTGIALLAAIRLAGFEPSFWTIVVGHATFCLVIVYNNVVARFRRTPGSMVEASMDLGADGFQTFRHVVLPSIATALLAGGMLAFALSFDEIIVTTFTAGAEKTLPIWFFGELFRPRDRPVTNVVAVMVILVTAVPILASYYLTRGTESVAGTGK